MLKRLILIPIAKLFGYRYNKKLNIFEPKHVRIVIDDTDPSDDWHTLAEKADKKNLEILEKW